MFQNLKNALKLFSNMRRTFKGLFMLKICLPIFWELFGISMASRFQNLKNVLNLFRDMWKIFKGLFMQITCPTIFWDKRLGQGHLGYIGFSHGSFTVFGSMREVLLKKLYNVNNCFSHILAPLRWSFSKF